MVENGQDRNFYNAEALFRFVFRLFFFFLQRVHFRASNHITIHKNVIRKTRHSRPFSIEGRVGSEILVPPIPPTELKYCNIIDIHYELVVSVRLSRP